MKRNCILSITLWWILLRILWHLLKEIMKLSKAIRQLLFNNNQVSSIYNGSWILLNVSTEILKVSQVSNKGAISKLSWILWYWWYSIIKTAWYYIRYPSRKFDGVLLKFIGIDFTFLIILITYSKGNFRIRWYKRSRPCMSHVVKQTRWFYTCWACRINYPESG